MVSGDMGKTYCRTCFDPGKNFFALTEMVFEAKSVLDLLRDIVQLQVPPDDPLPKMVCCYCADRLKNAYNFITQAQDANKKYRQLLSSDGDPLEDVELKNDNLLSDCLEESTIDIPISAYIADVKLEEDPSDNYNIILSHNDQEPNENCTKNDNRRGGKVRDTLLFRSSSVEVKDDVNQSDDNGEHNSEAEIRENTENEDDFQHDGAVNASSSDESNYEPAKKVKRKTSVSSTKKRRVGRQPPEYFDKIKKVNDRYGCIICEKTFSLRKDCGRHIASIHLRQTTFSCEYCGQEFSRKDKVRTHVKRMHSVRPVYPKGKHKERVFGDRLYGKPTKWLLVECKLCDIQFNSTNELRAHLETHINNDTLGHLEMDSGVVKHLFTNAMSLECVKESITKDIKDRQWFKYYAVLNEYSYEMAISDTEVEDIEAEGTPSAKYKCHLCEMEFAFKYEAYGHLKESHGSDEIPFKCGLCKLDFVSSKMFDQHSRIHCRNRHKVLLCSRCPAKFVWPENMRNHSCATKGEVVIDKEPMKCHICDRAYEVKTKLLKHIESHDLEKTMAQLTIRCGLCAQSFERMKHLRKHITVHSDGATAIDFKNSIYLKIFEKSKTLDLALLKQEIRNAFKTSQISRFYKAIDKDGNELDILDSDSGSDDDNESSTESRYKCEVCSEIFGRRKHLLHHQQELHSDIPLPFNCDDCTKQFVSNDLLQQHLHRDCWNEHRRVAQQCEYCNARFIWQSNLMKHKEIQHKHQRQFRPKRARTLKCEYCEKVFIWPKDLVRHKKTHTEGKQFACPHCDRKFQRKDNLLVHIRTHDPDVISLVVNSNKTVDRILPHLMKPHGCKRIICMICHSQHNRIRDLRSHLRSHQYSIDFEKRKEIESIDSISKQLYPEDRPMSEEELAKKISSDIFTELNLERFYSITDENGYEVNLDSSETESDSDYEADDEQHNKTKVERCKRTYKCDICPQLAFDRKYKVYEHHNNAHKWEDGHHICIHCNSRFISSFMLQLHYKEQCKNAKKRHFCRRCPLRFMWKSNLKAHIAMEHPPGTAKDSETNGRFECFLCQRTFLSQKDLARHMSSNHSADSDLHYCLLCPKTFYDIGHLNDHLTGHHINVSDFSAVESIIHSTCWPNGEKSVKCMICSLEFQTMAELAQHFSPENPQNICSTQHSLSNYSITNQKGYEMHLELDSETEPEETSGRAEEDESRNTGKPYICCLCNVSCERKYQMAQHQRSMHIYETLPLKCSNCIFKTVCQRLLDYHTATQCHNLEKQHSCDLCKHKFMWQENLDNHVSIVHHSLSAQSCASSKDLESGHKYSKEINIFECMECHRRYNRRDRYKAHFKKFHSGSAVTPEKEKELKTSAMKSKHFLCPFCGVNFSSNSNLTVHMRRHTGEKPFKCDLCEMAFPRSSDLQSHYRTHTGEKPYKCTYCDKSFSRQYKLNVHVRIHTGERPYSCTYCPKSFTQSNDLTLHVRRHTGERPYSCEVCGEGFICATSLKQHRNSKGHHTDTKEEQPTQLPHFELNF